MIVLGAAREETLETLALSESMRGRRCLTILDGRSCVGKVAHFGRPFYPLIGEKFTPIFLTVKLFLNHVVI